MTTERTSGLAPGWYDDPLGQARMRYWDGAHWTAQTSQSKNPENESQRGELGSGFAHVSDWLSRLLTFGAVLGLAWGAMLVWELSVLGTSPGNAASLLDRQSASYSPAAAESMMHIALTFLALLVVQLLVSLTTVVLWLCWQFQLAKHCPVPLRRSAGLQVFSWIIPIVSYWWPYQDINSLWRGYGRNEKERRSPAPAVVGLWWLTWILLVLTGAFVASKSMVSVLLGDPAPGIGIANAILAVGAIALPLLAGSVVRTLSWRALAYFASVSS